MALPWSDIASGLAVGAAAATLASAFLGAAKVWSVFWRRSIGRRRHQAALLDRLACGASMSYIESLLGPSLFVSPKEEGTEHVYRLPGAWVLVFEAQGSVRWFSITVRAKAFRYSTERLTHGQLRIRLGKDSVQRRPQEPEGACLWLGARRGGYLERHYFGNPGAYQYYWLSYSESGCGSIPPGPQFRSGCYDLEGESDVPEPDLNRSEIIANTLTVLGPDQETDSLMHRSVLGADLDLVRLSAS